MLEIDRLDFLQHSAAVDYSTSQFSHHWKEMHRLRDKVSRQILPWLPSLEAVQQTVAQMLASRYRQVFGDPQDPAYQAQMQQLQAYWEQNRGQPRRR